VAVVGGGMSGSVAAAALARGGLDVTLFDWGRSVGGRSSHRFRPEPCEDGVARAYAFDHGAQFFHVSDEAFRALVAAHATRWPLASDRVALVAKGAFADVHGASVGASEGEPTFFGAGRPDLAGARHVAVGGMGALAHGIVEDARRDLAASACGGRLTVNIGTRVASVARAADGRWALHGDGLGHEQSTAAALEASGAGAALGTFDMLLVADHMALAMPDWHPCCVRGLAAAAPRLVGAVRAALCWDEAGRAFGRIQPLFTCMVAFDARPAAEPPLPFDAAAIARSDVLQWACAQRAKPHATAADGVEAWVLVSTAHFARRCLDAEGLSAARADGSAQYLPQVDEYLRADPAELMVDEWLALLGALPGGVGEARAAAPAKVVFAKCQRWGAAYCASGALGDGERDELAGARDEAVRARGLAICGDYLADLGVDGGEADGEDLAAAGTSGHPFAMQRAALSGLRAAARMLDA
jgi:predicted NAD/FAD-dependent oxidoreductase